MEPNLLQIEPLLERAEKYGKTSIELIKLKAIHKSAHLVGNLMFSTLLFIIAALFVILITIGASLWLGDVLGKVYYGFFAVSVVYLIAGLIVYLFMRTTIQNRITNSIIYNSLN